MAVEFYKCELCGNIIAVIKSGGESYVLWTAYGTSRTGIG